MPEDGFENQDFSQYNNKDTVIIEHYNDGLILRSA